MPTAETIMADARRLLLAAVQNCTFGTGDEAKTQFERHVRAQLQAKARAAGYEAFMDVDIAWVGAEMHLRPGNLFTGLLLAGVPPDVAALYTGTEDAEIDDTLFWFDEGRKALFVSPATPTRHIEFTLRMAEGDTP